MKSFLNPFAAFAGTGRRLSLPVVTAALLVLVTLSTRGAEDAAPLLLQVKWGMGQKQLLRVTTFQDQEISGAGMPAPMKQQTRQQQDIAIRVVKEAEAGGKELEMSYARMLTESKMGEMTMMKFDSSSSTAEDASNPVAPMLRAMAGAKFRLTVDAQGQVTKVDGVRELTDKLASQVPPMMRGMLDGMLNDDMVKQMASTPAALPGKPVKVGDTWPFKQELAMGPLGKLNLNLTMRLKGWEEHDGKRCAVIEQNGTLSAANDAGTNAITVLALQGDVSGLSWFDAAAGVMRESVSTQKMDIKMQAMGQELSSHMTQVLTNKLVEFTPGR